MKPETGLIPHTTAEELASTFQRCTGRIRELITELGEQTDQLRDTFAKVTNRSCSDYHFGVSLYAESSRYSASAQSADTIIENMKRHAWAILIDKMEVRRMMSSARQNEMSRTLNGESSEPIPEITAETILDVLNGFIASADTFLAEAVREEYEFWKPHRETYKTNVKHSDGFTVLGRKVIREYMVENRYGGQFDLSYDRQSHVMSLDNIFHLLDGKGIVKEHCGPLASAIKQSGREGIGETDYFKFKCYKNRNLHLEFKRQDLLDKFNQIAGSNLLGNKGAA